MRFTDSPKEPYIESHRHCQPSYLGNYELHIWTQRREHQGPLKAEWPVLEVVRTLDLQAKQALLPRCSSSSPPCSARPTWARPSVAAWRCRGGEAQSARWVSFDERRLLSDLKGPECTRI